MFCRVPHSLEPSVRVRYYSIPPAYYSPDLSMEKIILSDIIYREWRAQNYDDVTVYVNPVDFEEWRVRGMIYSSPSPIRHAWYTHGTPAEVVIDHNIKPGWFSLVWMDDNA